MSTMLVSVKREICSGCATCISVCPFDAIKRDHILAEVDIDLEKCQLCGICYTACPASAIDITYYDSKTLIEKLRSLKEKRASDTLVLMCRGNSPSTCDVYKILKERGIETAEYIPLRLPCAGRVPVEVILHALNLGIRKVISIQCDDRYCRFKQGTKASTSRFALLNILLEQVGYDHDLITVVKHSRKVIYNTEECVGCGKCVFICPFGAIEAEDLGTPKIDLDLCVGCGACALVCPHGAIQLEGYELNNIITMISRLGETAKKLKERGKAPIILAFCCQWSEFLNLDQPENLLLKRNTFTIEIPCFKALDPFYVIEAFKNGFDAVLAVVCSEEECKLKDNEAAERNMVVLKKALEKLNLSDRFQLLNVSPKQVGEFTRKLEAFLSRISTLQIIEEVVKGKICTR